MTHLLLHSLLATQLLSASPEETHFIEAITKDDVAAVREALQKDPGLAQRAKTARGNSAVVAAAFLMEDGEYFYAPSKNEVLHEVLRRAPPVDAFEACVVGDLPRARAFLDKDPDAMKTEKVGWTLLHAAAYSGNVELVRLLLKRGAAIDAVANTKYKNTPIQTAMLSSQGAVARVLVDAGADINHKQWEGFTVLHDAASRGDLDLVRFFVKRGADVNARTIRGETPAMSAQNHKHPEVAAELERLASRSSQ